VERQFERNYVNIENYEKRNGIAMDAVQLQGMLKSFLVCL
jgi:hypothetical protein